MTPLEIVAFFDGRPGHEKQTRGILSALSRLTPLSVHERWVRPGSVLKSLKAWIQYFRCRIRPDPRSESRMTIDLIIGTGTHTHLPMLMLKERSGARVVTCMTPAYPLIRRMDLCFVPMHDGVAAGGNRFTTVGPPNTAHPMGAKNPQKGLILIGGIDEKSHRWSTGRILSQIQSLLQKESSLRWTLSSSPRTPQETIAAVAALAARHPHAEFFRSESTPAGWIEKQYSENQTVWVTADSISMVFEALTAGCRVGLLPVAWKGSHSKIKRSVDYLIAHRWVTPFETWSTGGRLVGGETELNEARRCAEEILKRWWPERFE